ncbi:glycine-rich protein [Nocardia sp. No.11]|uniref:glycine-rich protein n=1 Tax=Nocardia sp. No.11 TaxID=3128861 RepID=UPI00319E4C66
MAGRTATRVWLAASLGAVLVVGTAALAQSQPPGPPAEHASEHFEDPESGLAIDVFYCSSGTQTYTVPAGTTSLYIEAVGGQGQTPNPNFTGIGGLGGQVSGGLRVTPEQQFQVQVGCAGGANGGFSPYAPGGARGEAVDQVTNFGTVYSSGWDGGGGGGASAVLGPDNAPVLVAGGGGGAGGNAPDCYSVSPVQDSTFFYCGGGSRRDGGNGGRR